MTKLKLGIVGLGTQGDIHAQEFKATGLAEVVAVCDVNEQHATKFAQTYGATGIATDYNQLLEENSLDAISIATPNHLHYPITMAAVKKGIHVFCEKPLSVTVAEAEEMTATARKMGVVHGMNFKNRAIPCFVMADHLIKKGSLGKVFYLRADFYQDWLVRSSQRVSNVGRGWRLDPSLSGAGVLNDLGSHLLDLIQLFVGNITAVQAYLGFREQAADNQNDDYAVLLGECANGALAQVTVSRTAVGYDNYCDMVIQGSERSLWLNKRFPKRVHLSQDTVTLDNQDWEAVPVPEELYPPSPFESFIQGIVNGTPCIPSFDDGLRVQRILSAAEVSAKEKRRVNV